MRCRGTPSGGTCIQIAVILLPWSVTIIVIMLPLSAIDRLHSGACRALKDVVFCLLFSGSLFYQVSFTGSQNRGGLGWSLNELSP